jgi:hypothetical protein
MADACHEIDNRHLNQTKISSIQKQKTTSDDGFEVAEAKMDRSDVDAPAAKRPRRHCEVAGLAQHQRNWQTDVWGAQMAADVVASICRLRAA